MWVESDRSVELFSRASNNCRDARAVAENWLLGKLAWAESDLENAAADDAELGAAVASDASLNSEVFTELVLTGALLMATVPDVLQTQSWVQPTGVGST